MIIVVGGTGFIGKNLLSSGCLQPGEVLSVSRNPDTEFLNKYAPDVSSCTIYDLCENPDLLARCTSLIWMAGKGGPSQNVTTPWLELSESVEPVLKTACLLQNCNQDAHFVYLSSGGTVYGNNDADRVSETQPLKPISPYGMGKVLAENALQLLASSRGLGVTILRPSNPIGPWQTGRVQGVVAALLACAESGEPFQLLGDGTAVRDYIDVDDLVRAIDVVIKNPDKATGQIYNVGSGVPTDVNTIISIVGHVLGYDIRVTKTASRGVDVKRVVLDCRKIREDHGWQAHQDIEKTILRIARHRGFVA